MQSTVKNPASLGTQKLPKNNFDFIRISAATLVLFSHHFALTGKTEPSFLNLHSIGGFSVMVFFVISGYLVTSSWYNDPNFMRFSMRRVLRIWPALTAVVVLTAYGLGTLVTELPAADYVKHRATLDYLGTLWMRVHYMLPGVFENNLYPHSVNGSLWTIPLEVRCYIVLAFAGLFGFIKKKTFLLLIIAVYMLWFLKNGNADFAGKIHYGRELSAFFLAGAALYCLQTFWERKPWHWMCAVSICTAVAWYFELKYTALWLSLPFFVIYFGTRSSPFARQFGRWGDPSYGIYLIAFPVQQTVILYFLPELGFVGTMFLSMLITTILAYASWHGIEKQALKLKPRRK